jgi:hypothetical protein
MKEEIKGKLKLKSNQVKTENCHQNEMNFKEPGYRKE